MGRPQANHVIVDPSNPQAAGQCDLCGRWYQLRTLRPQAEWAGNHLYTFESRRCRECWDKPQEQFRTIILPPDPPPLPNARVPNFAYEEQTTRIVQFAGRNIYREQSEAYGSGPQLTRCDQTGMVPRTLQYLTSS